MIRHEAAPPLVAPGRIVEAIDGIVVRDPYRTLEEDSPEALIWQADETGRAMGFCRGDLFRRLLPSVEGFLGAEAVFAPVFCRAGWFRQSSDGGLIVSRTLNGSGKVLSPGPREPEDNEAPSFSWFQPSPDGRFVAYGAAEGGGRQGGAQLLRLRVLDTATGEDLPIRIPHVTAAVQWLPDSSGLYIVYGAARATENPERRVGFQSLDESYLFGIEPLRGLGFGARVEISPGGRYLAVRTGRREPRTDWILDHRTGEWRPFLMHVPAACFGAFAGDEYLAVTTWRSPRGRIVSIPLSSADDPATWREVVPETKAVIRDITVVGEMLVVCEFHEAVSRLRVMRTDGTEACEVPLPGPGSIFQGWLHSLGTPAVSPGIDGFAFVHSQYDRSPSLHWYDFGKSTVAEVVPPAMQLADAVILHEQFTADDGELVPVVLVSRKGVVTTPAPTIIFCYGAYNFAMVPGWIGMLGPFVEAGGIAAFAHVRGGGEFGTLWWREGHHENKQRSFDDIYAVAEGLVYAQHTTSEQLGIVGLSNGGTNVCTAIIQRPGLFRAGAALAPHCDLLRYNRDHFCGGVATTGHHQGLHVNSGTWRDPTWGREGADPPPERRRAHFPQAMYPDPLAYSPYHLVEDGVAYPALLLVCGSEDVWCPPWHSRKLAARLQAATASSHPVLLRCWEGAGHIDPVSDPQQVAEWLAFLMAELGMS
ncbi:prolyl oligopeptidase family serine peptidase [Mesorhizobium sp. M1156]|uniref:prolyl oligopeptidase family serine peptidase n=1 Tax=Mesorhizobium sp. M1156 TaxID=2957064 RepID=UPI003337DBB9